MDHGVVTYVLDLVKHALDLVICALCLVKRALDLVNYENVYSPYALNRSLHGGLNDVLLNFGGNTPRKLKFWGVNRTFKPERQKFQILIT